MIHVIKRDDSKKEVDVEPTAEKLEQIMNLFRFGFCTEEMARDIYKVAIK